MIETKYQKYNKNKALYERKAEDAMAERDVLIS
jgi:hypothetical protein